MSSTQLLESSYSNVFEVCKILAEENELKITIEESGKGALIAGLGAFLGGVLGGPVGLGIGGTLGSVIGMCQGAGKYKSLVSILNDLTPSQKHRLSVAVHKCLEEVNTADVVRLALLISTNASLKELVIKEIGTFVYSEFGKALC